MRQLLAMILAVSLLLGFADPAAAVVVSPILDYQASLDTTPANDVWEELNGITAHNWTLNGAPFVPVIGSAFNVSDAYQFDGSTVASTLDFEKIAGTNYDKGPASFEFLFKPDDLSVGEKDLIFESGGGTDGSAFFLQDSILWWRSKDGGANVRAEFDLSAIGTSDFIHVVSVVDIAANTAQLYVNGVAGVLGGGGNPNDWCGGSDTGLAGVFSGTAEGGTSSFEGQVSLLRFYNTLFTQGDVNQLYTELTTTPDPTLTWDGLGDAEWAHLTGGTASHWLGDELNSVPGATNPAVVLTNTVTVAGVREALSLTIQSGTVNVLDGGELGIFASILPSAGILEIDDGGEVSVLANVEMSLGSTATIDGLLEVSGDVTLAGTVGVGATGALEGANVNLPVGSTAQIDGLLSSLGNVNIAGAATVGATGQMEGVDVDVASGATLVLDGTLTSTGTVNLRHGSTATLNGTVNADTLIVSTPPTLGAAAAVTATSGLTLNTSLDASGIPFTVDTANVAVHHGSTLTYDQALTVGGLDLDGSLTLTAVDKTVTVNGGTMSVNSTSTLTGVDNVALSAGTLSVAQQLNPGAIPGTPVAGWNFEDGTGSTAENAITPGTNDGALTNFAVDDTQWVDGLVGGALQFDGSSWVNAGDTSLTNYTLSMWVKADSLVQNHQNDSVFATNEGNSAGFQIDVDDVNAGEYRYHAGPDINFGPVETDWVHLALSYDGATLRTYYNGQPANSVDIPLVDAHGFSKFFIGRNRGDAHYFPGTIDEVYVYAAALDDATIADIFGTPTAPDTASLNLQVEHASALNSNYAGETVFATLDLADAATLTLDGPGSFRFGGTTIAPGDILPATATLEVIATTMPGPIEANDGTLIKTGSGDLILDPDGSGLSGATLVADDGRLVAVHDGTNPLSDAALQVGTGELLLAAADGGAASVAVNNLIRATGIGTLTAGAGGVDGTQIGATVSLSNLTLDLDSSLTVQATDGYTLNVTGSIAGEGDMGVASGTTLNLSGSMNTTGNVGLPVGAKLNVTGVSSTVRLGGTDLRGELAMNAAGTGMVTVAGGTMQLQPEGTLTGVTTIALEDGTLDVPRIVSAGTDPDATNLEGRWTFDDGTGSVAADSLGVRPGTLSGFAADDLQWVPGVSGSALQFDGSDDQVDITGYKGVIGITPRTVTGWVRTSENNTAIVRWGSNNDGAHWVIRTNGGKLRAEVNGGNVVGTADISDDEWHHVAVVFPLDLETPDVTDVLLYVDGQPEAIGSSTDEPVLTASGVDVQIGASNNNSHDFLGTMDDVQIYSRALEAAEIAAMYGGETPRNMSAMNLLVDGASTVTSSSAGEMTFAGAELLDLSSLSLTGPGSFDLTATTVASGTATLDVQATTRPGPIAANGGTLIKTGSGDLILDPDGSGLTGATLVADGGRLISVLGATNPLGDAALQVGGGEALLAVADGAAGPFVYDNAVTGTGYGMLTAGAGGVAGTATGATVTLSSGITVDAGARLAVTTADDYTLNVAGNTVVNGGTLALSSLDLTGMTNVALNGGTLDLTAAVITPGTVAANPLAHWKCDDGTGATADNDATGDGTNDGTLMGFPDDDTQWVPGVDGTALQFDNSDDFVRITGYKGISGTAARTTSAWIKVPPGAANEAIVSWGTNSGGQKWVFRVQDSNGQAGAIRLEVNGGYRVGTTDIRDNQWHHVVAVFPEDGNPNVNDVLLYVDGQDDGQSAVLGQGVDTAAAGEDVRIGVDHNNLFFNGAIDDVVLYDRALSPEEVAAMVGSITVTDTSGMNVTVDGNSTIRSAATGTTAFPSLVIDNGVLTTDGPGTISFATTTIAAGAAAPGFNTEADTELVALDGSGTAATVTKAGAGNLALGTVAGLQAASVNVQGGGLSMANDLTVANLAVGPGTVMNTGTSRAIVSNTLRVDNVPIQVSAGQTISVTGSDLAATANLTVGGGTVTIGATSDVAGAVANWKFDETFDLTAADESGNWDGTLTGFDGDDTQWVAGMVGGALEFDGVDDFVNTSYGGIGGSDSRTVAMWVKTTDTSNHGLVGWGDSAINGAKWQVRVNPNATGALRTEAQGGNMIGTTNIADGQWHHIVSVFEEDLDPNNLDVVHYVDGVLEPVGSSTDEPINTDNLSAPVTIGARTQGGAIQSGAMTLDEVYIYDRAISPAEVAVLFDQGVYVPGNTVDLSTNNVNVTADTQITSVVDAVQLGNLTVADTADELTLDGAAFNFNDAAIADGVTVVGELVVRGTLNVGDGIGTMTIAPAGILELDTGATYNAEVSLADLTSLEADTIVNTVAGAQQGDPKGNILMSEGKLAPKGVGRTDSASFTATTSLTIIDNTAGGIGGILEPPTEVTTGSDGHIGQGAFLRDVTYVGVVPITEVKLDVVVALEGDVDGDGLIGLDDWDAFRANFGSTGANWTEGNFDPWSEDLVDLDDWDIFRSRFGQTYVIDPPGGAAAAVPEPGTIVMLLGALAGLAVAVRRRRRA